MHRYRGQKALYEAIKRSQERMRQSQIVPLHEEEEKTAPPTSQPVEEQPDHNEVKPQNAVRRTRWQRPKPVQVNAGRLEFALPIPVVFIVVIAIFLCIIVSFRYGQYVAQAARPVRPSLTSQINSKEQPSPVGRLNSLTAGTQNDLGSVSMEHPIGSEDDSETTGPGNAIVILNWNNRTQLMPLQKHFAKHGVEMEIRTEGSRYILVSKKRFTLDPQNKGTKGYRYRQMLIELAKQYAPSGSTIFGPKSFDGAYGKKLKD